MKREIARSQQLVPPDGLTVEEAAAVLRISRTKAYAQVNEYLDGGGESGIPAIRIARQIRVPRTALEEWLGGPITWPIPQSTESPRAATPTITLVHPTSRDSRAPRESAQLALAIDG
jgi:excisionase family DNA binding protein